ncbi:MAG TPA: uracil-DNA glycosylase [Anaeromyxobacteraceae bacterium]|jgi:DNA polymerase
MKGTVGSSRMPSGVLAEVAREAARHLGWLREEGIDDVPVVPIPTATSGGQGPPDREGRGEGGVRYSLSDKGCGSAPLLAIRQDLGECTRCKLAGGRTRLVFGVGNPKAELMFVGEGPGADEDLQGEPFVGKAGQLLTRMIEAMGFARSEVYIGNVVKCRPPRNRDPEPDEIEACEPFLRAQIAAIGPKVIVALGRFAVQALLRDPSPISRQRGRWREYQGVRLMPTFHPAYLLRSPAEKTKAWADLKMVMKEFGKEPPKKVSP